MTSAPPRIIPNNRVGGTEAAAGTQARAWAHRKSTKTRRRERRSVRHRRVATLACVNWEAAVLAYHAPQDVDGSGESVKIQAMNSLATDWRGVQDV